MAGEVDLIWFLVRLILERWRSFFSLWRDWSETQKKHHKVPIEDGAWRDFDVFHDFSTISAAHHVTIEPWVSGIVMAQITLPGGRKIGHSSQHSKKASQNLPKNPHGKGFSPKTVLSYLLVSHTMWLLASHDFVNQRPKAHQICWVWLSATLPSNCSTSNGHLTVVW